MKSNQTSTCTGRRPQKTSTRRRRVRELVKTFGADFWTQKQKIALAYLLNLLSVGAALVLPWPLKWIIDHVIGHAPLPGFWQRMVAGYSAETLVVGFSLGYVSLAMLAALFQAGHKVMIARVRERLSLRLRDRLLAHIQQLSPAMVLQHRSGEWVHRLVNDVNLFARLQTKTLPLIFRHLLSTVFILSAMLWMEPRLALMSGMLLPLLYVLVHRYGHRLGRVTQQKRHFEGEVAGLAQEIIRGLPTLQAMGAEAYMRKRFRQTNAQSLQAGVQTTRVAVGMEKTLQMAQGVTIALMTGGGAILVLRGYLTLGALTVLITYMIQLLKPVEKINELASAVARGITAGEQLLNLLKFQPLIRDHSRGIQLQTCRGEVEMKKVWFSYPQKSGHLHAVLRGVDLRLLPGRLTVITGASGSGKSTILNLLLRLYDPQAGEIYMDGQPLSRLSIASLRSQFSVMLQHTHLFAGTLREALTAHVGDKPESRLWQALSFVGLAEHVRCLPGGLDGKLGEDGMNFSGGQRKRLSLARAFLMNRPILLLDEPLANVDAGSAAIIGEALDRIRVGKSCLVISHQPAMVQRADVVYHLEDGQLRCIKFQESAPAYFQQPENLQNEETPI